MRYLKRHKQKSSTDSQQTPNMLPAEHTTRSPNIIASASETVSLGNKRISKKALIIFAVIFGVFGAYVIFRSFAAPVGVDPQTPHNGGRVNYMQPAEGRGGWDAIFSTVNADPTKQQWLRDHYWRMRTYDGGFGTRGYDNWYPTSWVYKDAYAIYNPGYNSQNVSLSYEGFSQLSAQDQARVLKDPQGNPLYLQYACVTTASAPNGTCSQYAADTGSAEFRTYWISDLKTTLNRAESNGGKYQGVFVDDVNYSFSVSNGKKEHVAPLDPRTGVAMTKDNWQKYFAEFMETLRTQLDSDLSLCGGVKCEIVHNTVFYQEGGYTNPYVKRGIATADFMEIERGFGDAGIAGGSGTFGIENLLNYIDYVQSEAADNDVDTTPNKKRGVVLDVQSNVMGKEYNLASYYLISNGRDSLGMTTTGYPDTWSNTHTTDKWWNGYDTDLGDPLAKWYKWTPSDSSASVLRRDFQKGFVLLNPPDSSTKTINLGGDYTRVKGDGTRLTVNGITLGYPLNRPTPTGAPDRYCNQDPCGVVLLNEGTVTPPPPPPPAVCADGIDNDGDGKTDYSADPGCASATDTDETDLITTPPPTGTNLALNKPVIASSVGPESPGLPATNAVDGSTASRWASARSDPQWIRVDLGNTQTVSKVVLNWEAAYGKAYQIQTSNDGTNWTTIHSVTNSDGGIDELTNLTGSGRYIRMNGTVRATTFGYSLWEFQVYGTAVSDPNPTPDPTPDTTLPVADITSPASGSTVSGNVTITASATDNVEVTSLEIYIDGNLYATTGSNSLTTSWNTKPKRWKNPATHTITVKAKDQAGNIGTKSVTVTVQ